MSLDEWSSILQGHPIFSLPDVYAEADKSLELSRTSLAQFLKEADEGTGQEEEDGKDMPPIPLGRRQVMCMRDSDMIVACGKELRITSLGDAKSSVGSSRTYKTIHTPGIDFNIHQILLNPNGKLLAVCGETQVHVVVLPRNGFQKVSSSSLDCKCVPVGEFYHTSSSSSIAKMEWHPWGKGGSTLLVMTSDGKLREYDLSDDPEEPQQTLSFVSKRKRNAFAAEDESEREVVSFCLGRGKADWGSLTVYALMKSGDVYAICPYLPQNAFVPLSYLCALECYVAQKQNSVDVTKSSHDNSFSILYDYQRKYVNGLLDQIAPEDRFSHSVSVHPPNVKNKVTRQGPFLLQPSPPPLKTDVAIGSTDIVYATFGSCFENDGYDEEFEETLKNERIGVLLITSQDGRVDICLDLEKVEARWDMKEKSKHALPMLAVFESVDLGLIDLLSQSPNDDQSETSLLEGNHPVFLLDPVHDDTVYVYHAFGVHLIHFGPVLKHLANALKDEKEDTLESALKQDFHSKVQHILTTYSTERRSSTPIIAATIPNDVYLTYSVFVLTSTMHATSFPLALRSVDSMESLQSSITSLPPLPDNKFSPYICSLNARPFSLPEAISRPSPKLSLPVTPKAKVGEITSETLRYFGQVTREFDKATQDVTLAMRYLTERSELQHQELVRQQFKCREMVKEIEMLNGQRRANLQEKATRVRDQQKQLLSRLERALRAQISKASSGLAENEVKWFEELKKIQAQIIGRGRFDQASLQSRQRLMDSELQNMLPELKHLSEMEKARKQSLEEGANLSFSQSFAYGKQSETERVRLEEAVKQVTKLAQKLDLSSIVSSSPVVKSMSSS